MVRGFALIAAASLLSQPASAGSAPAATLHGIWQETLGGRSIRACFNQERGSFGIYYYRSHFDQIALQQPDAATAVLIEGYRDDDKSAPRWTVGEVGKEKIAATWTHGKRSLPIVLGRVATALSEDETPCGSIAFHTPRLSGITTVRKAATFEGRAYTRLILDYHGHFGKGISVETFALTGASPAIAKINAILARPLDPKRDDSWFACVRMAADSSPYGADDNELLEPTLITAKWLAINQHSDNFCGGAHPNSANDPRLFDLTSGSEINLFDWFNDKAVKREHFDGEAAPFVTLQPAFQRLVMAGWKSDSECREAVKNENYWSVALTRSGFALTPNLAHVVQACGENFKLSFAEAAPYLNSIGKREVEAFNRR